MKIFCFRCENNIPIESIYDPLHEKFGLSKNLRWNNLLKSYFAEPFYVGKFLHNPLISSEVKIPTHMIDKNFFICPACSNEDIKITSGKQLADLLAIEGKLENLKDNSRESMYHYTIKNWFKGLSFGKRASALRNLKYLLPLKDVFFETEYMFKKDELPTEYIDNGWFSSYDLQKPKCIADVVAIDLEALKDKENNNEIKLVIEIDFDHRIDDWKWDFYTKNKLLCFEIELRTMEKIMQEDKEKPLKYNIFDFTDFRVRATNYDKLYS